MTEPAHQRALRVVATHRDDALADVLRQVSDPLEIVGDAQHRYQPAQIDRHRLTQRDRCDRLLLDLPLQLVDSLVGLDDAPRKRGVAARQRIDRIRHLLLGEAAHLRDQLRKLDEIGVEDTRGVIGNIHGHGCCRWRSSSGPNAAVATGCGRRAWRVQRIDDSTIRA